MKSITWLVTLSVVLTNLAWAKVNDFNSIINDNIQAQDHLHKQVKGNMDGSRQRVREEKAKNNVVMFDSDPYQVSAPSKKMRYRKEVYQYKPSMKKQMKRLANEFKQAEKGF